MDERIPPPPFFQHSPSGVHSSPHRHNPMWSSSSDRERYATPTTSFCVFHVTSLTKILWASSLPPTQNFVESEKIDHGSPLRLAGQPLNGQAMDLDRWSGMQTEHLGVLQSPSTVWNGALGIVGSPVVKKVVRIDVPVDKYPNDESMDYYKKQQLRELAILNGTLREESPSPHLSPSVSPFNSTGMKRAKTGR
ncbi:hypothetical protein BAE44_0007586 [Dichanthelium oligosanthes]|uniref:Uncharacterized protein n=1 Tax=Dichanthelium oligosanthes TaxID=888268 RepID=A0A1E5W216_9POAL|nr:hypothetical protein BAE44_0007586 [Dichanthelium oligosanthes]